MLLPFSLLYLLAVTCLRLFLRPRRYPFLVVGVGNLTAGGTGKTTLVEIIVRNLFRKFTRVVVVSSGIGSRGSTLLAPGRLARDPSQFGDEVVLLARKLPGTLFVKGKSKHRLVEIVARQTEPDAVVIDDALQSYHIKKDVEIALLDALNPFDNGFLLPAGLLRDLPIRLRRVEVIILTNSRLLPAQEKDTLIKRLKGYHRPVFSMNYREAGITERSGKTFPGNFLFGKDILAFAGIGQPFSFFALVREMQPRRLFTVAYPDHYCYQPQDVVELVALGERLGVDCWLMTEKDAVKVWRLDPPEKFMCLRIAAFFEDEKGREVAIDNLLRNFIE